MDISKIDIDYIELFDLCYTVATDVFKIEPISASPKMKKKIRRWFEKNYIAGGDYPYNVMEFIGKDVSDEKLFAFLNACHHQIEVNKQLFDNYVSDLSEEVKTALWDLLEDDYSFCDIRKENNNAIIDLELGSSYDRTLTLINASGIPEGNFYCILFEKNGLTKQGNEYRLTGVAENYDDDLSTPFEICFTDAKIHITLFKADEQILYDTPWMYLQSVAGDILSKHFLGNYLNESEKELLPLIAEISKLSYWTQIPDEYKSADFSQLKSYIVKFGYTELLPLVENLEKEFFNDKKKDKVINKLVSKLNTQKYEPLWRELYNELVKTQENYPSKDFVYFSTELLNETRNNIQSLMEHYGYSGKYPDFIKQGFTDKIHLAESYNTTYFVGHEKNVFYHIHCTEEYFNEHLLIQFACGTELLRKDESPGDIYSCLFNAKGRRFFKTLSYESNYINEKGEKDTDDLEKRVQIAVKKAELKKLTKEERKEIGDVNIKLILFSLFILMGVLFGLFMTVGFMLIGIILCLVVGQAQAIPSMFTEIPWWGLFLFSSILFGGTMGIITVLDMRK